MNKILAVITFALGTGIFAQVAPIRVTSGGIGTNTIGGNDGLSSHMCKSTDGTKFVTCVPAATNTPTNTGTATATNTPTVTPTDTNTPTSTPTNTPTDTPTITGTRTTTPTPTNTPTYTFTPVVVAGTWFGSAVAFQENNSPSPGTAYMTVPDNAALDSTTGVTVSLWFKTSGSVTANTGQGLWTKATAAGGTGAAACGDYTLLFNINGTSNGELSFGVNGSSACAWGAIAQYAKIPSLHHWIHVVGAYSKTQGNAKLYVDGVLQATSGAYSTNLNTTGTIGVLGAYFDKSVAARACNCSIDDVRIYKDAALSAGDVTTLYNGGRGSHNLLGTETVVWRFDEGTGTTATDEVSGLVLTSGGAKAVDWVEGIIPDR